LPEEAEVKKFLLLCSLAGVAATGMEKVESEKKEFSLREEISLIEAYMYGDLTIQEDSNRIPRVYFYDYFMGKLKDPYVVRLRDAILCLCKAKEGYDSIYLDKSESLDDEEIFKLQRLRLYNWSLSIDLPATLTKCQLDTISAARENWNHCFLWYGTKELIEKGLKGKKDFRSRFIPLEKVLCAKTENVVLTSCEREKLDLSCVLS
jgi:hypothetical protein